MQTRFRRHIALPQDHGSWVFLFSPLLIGLFAGKTFTSASLALVLAALAAFLLRQPMTIALKAYTGRRPRSELPAASFWIFIYGFIVCISISSLMYQGYPMILLLGLPAVPVFAWHLWLVSRREERRQAAIEILATGVLALAAPAAFWIGENAYHPLGWVLWILTWFQSAASIIYAYLRLEQRDWQTPRSLVERYRAGTRALTFAACASLLTLLLAALALVSPWVILPALIQLAETLWGTIFPATGLKPTAIGARQLAVSTLFTLSFILAWKTIH